MLTLLVVALIGCAPQVRNDVPTAPVKTNSNPAQPLIENRESTINTTLAGTYYRGDGMGFNLTLSLRKDGTFKCNWTGCLGAYGSSSGTWSAQDGRILTQTLTEDGMMQGKPIGSLAIVYDEGEPLLVQDSDREFFDKHGPSRFACFSLQEN